MSVPDEERFAAINALEEQLLEALGRGQMQSTITLDTLAWLSIMQEVKNRNPRNYSQLLRDDMMDRMNDAIDRLHEEVNYMVAEQKGMVAKRDAPDRTTAPMRSRISSALQRSLKGFSP